MLSEKKGENKMKKVTAEKKSTAKKGKVCKHAYTLTLKGEEVEIFRSE